MKSVRQKKTQNRKTQAPYAAQTVDLAPEKNPKGGVVDAGDFVVWRKNFKNPPTGQHP
jgi:hypothetical protein